MLVDYEKKLSSFLLWQRIPLQVRKKVQFDEMMPEYMNFICLNCGKKKYLQRRSSQFKTQLMQLRKESLKKFRLTEIRTLTSEIPVYYESIKGPVPSWLARIAEVRVPIPASPKFFRLSSRNWISCVLNCDDLLCI